MASDQLKKQADKTTLQQAMLMLLWNTHFMQFKLNPLITHTNL